MFDGPYIAQAPARLRLATLLVGLAVTLVVATPASAAGDPVASGSFRLTLSEGFRNQLARNGVQMKKKAFAVRDGSINPTTGTGTLDLAGKLTFRHKDRKVVYKQLSARLGANGVLKGKLKQKAFKVFELRGAKANRNGFGADIVGVKARFVGSAARKLNRRLGLGSLRAARAGSVRVSEQPRTVEVIGGIAHLVPNPDLTHGVGNVASKLAFHCINFISGNTPIAPAIKAGPTGAPFYDLPVSGGTIGPQGTDGEVNTAGGILVKNNNNDTSASEDDGCNDGPAPPLAEFRQLDSSYNLLKKYVSSHIVISQLTGTVPTAGDHGVGIGAILDPTNATVSADADNHTVTINGLVIRFNGGSALFLNQTFFQPQSTYIGAQQFASGDLFGTVDLTVTTR
jgi:hypothetical protein